MGLVSGLEHIVRFEEPLSQHTWLRLGGPASYFAEPTTPEELSTLVRRCREQDTPVRLLGHGSNVLVRDEGFQGVVVHLGAPAFCEIRVEKNMLSVGGGTSLTHTISSAVREGLAGLETLVGIPGSVGAALHGNSGRQHADIGQYTHAAVTMTRTGEIIRRKREDLQFSYRQSSLNELVILGAEFHLESEDPVVLTKRMQELWIVAKSKQPAGDQVAGRIFRNPHGILAADLIDQAGLKGTGVGAAQVSERNANYVVAHPGATVDDVLTLIEQMRTKVASELDIELETDIEVW